MTDNADEKQSFPLADVLAIVTGKMLYEQDEAGAMDILHYMTQPDLISLRYEEAMLAARKAILEQVPIMPELANILASAETDEELAFAFTQTLAWFPPTVELSPCTDWKVRHPVATAIEQLGLDYVAMIDVHRRN